MKHDQRRIFIGDVHGHFDGLMHLLEEMALGADDRIFFLGDLIDRGPKSAQVVNFVRENGHPCILGNHECLAIDAFPEFEVSEFGLQAWLYGGGRSTLESYQHVGNDALLFEHLEWMRELPLYIDLEDFWLVHAGVDPTRSLAEQGHEQFCWIRGDFHQTAEPYFTDKTIAIGHTITFTFPGVEPGKIVRGAGWIDIDTGAYHPLSGWLTGLDVTHQQVYQVNVRDRTTRCLSVEEAAVPYPKREMAGEPLF